MNNRERLRYEMFVRAERFGRDNERDFPSGSIGKTQFDEIAAAVALINELSGDRTEASGAARFDFESKGTARENLREEMRDISRTARSMVYQFPGINLKFRLPYNSSDADLLAAARAFEDAATQHQADFVLYGLPAAFRTELRASIAAFEESLSVPGTAIDAQVSATAEIGAAVRRGMIAVRVLNGVVKNKYRSNIGKLAAWLSASHIERLPVKEEPPAKPTT